MKGYKVDVKKKKIELVDDKLPFPDYPSYQEPEGIDLSKIKQFLANLSPQEAKKIKEWAKSMGII